MATNVVPEDGIKRIAIRYAIAALAAVVALLLRRLLAPLVGTQLAYMALWPAAVFSSWYCGVGRVVLAAATSPLFGSPIFWERNYQPDRISDGIRPDHRDGRIKSPVQGAGAELRGGS